MIENVLAPSGEIERPKILIMGSMPSEQSLAKRQFYGNPNNAFWKIMASVFNGGDLPSDYKDKIALLKANGIVLSDLLLYCDRVGSMDNKIKNPQPNLTAFESIINCGTLKKIVINGKGNMKYFERFYSGYDLAGVKVIAVVSSSGAAGMQLEKKAAIWRVALLK